MNPKGVLISICILLVLAAVFVGAVVAIATSSELAARDVAIWRACQRLVARF